MFGSLDQQYLSYHDQKLSKAVPGPTEEDQHIYNKVLAYIKRLISDMLLENVDTSLTSQVPNPQLNISANELVHAHDVVVNCSKNWVSEHCKEKSDTSAHQFPTIPVIVTEWPSKPLTTPLYLSQEKASSSGINKGSKGKKRS